MAEVHHAGQTLDNSALVICEDHEYHMLLEVQGRAFDACSHADWRKCRYCKRYAPLGELIRDGSRNSYRHSEGCGND